MKNLFHMFGNQALIIIEYIEHTKQNNLLRLSFYSSGFKGFGFQMFLTRFRLFFGYFMYSLLKLAQHLSNQPSSLMHVMSFYISNIFFIFMSQETTESPRKTNGMRLRLKLRWTLSFSGQMPE